MTTRLKTTKPITGQADPRPAVDGGVPGSLESRQRAYAATHKGTTGSGAPAGWVNPVKTAVAKRPTGASRRGKNAPGATPLRLPPTIAIGDLPASLSGQHPRSR